MIRIKRMERVGPALYILNRKDWNSYWDWMKEVTDNPTFRKNVEAVKKVLFRK